MTVLHAEDGALRDVRSGAPTSAVRTPAKSGPRWDIQGLRALAVGLVIADHLFGRPVGGFVGVDVFFVISGFLITQLLLREHDRDGRISYLDFYRRRVRRIVPLAVVVLVSTVLATYAIFGGSRAEGVTEDAGWAFAFLANWHFAAVGTDYFLGYGPISPLQHYWSLSVEEQFYVVWPTLLVAALWVGRRLGHARRGAFVVALVGCVGFLAYSLSHTASDPVAAYFSTADRAWELGAGAVLAMVAPSLTRLPLALRMLLGWGGLAGIAAAAFLITPESAFPAPWALLPVLATCAVIAGGCGGEQRYLVPLHNRAARYLGDISYSLYLWHFPVVILAPAVLPIEGLPAQLVMLALIVAVSAVSFHLVEDPIRHSQWLEPRHRRRLRSGPVNHSHRVANGWIAVGALVLVPLVAATLSTGVQGQTESVLAAKPPAAQKVGDRGDTQAAYLSERVQQSLRLESFPELQPPVERLGVQAWYDQTKATGCLSVAPGSLAQCRFGDPAAARTAVVVGDSYAIAWMPAIRAALGKDHQIQQLTLQECPAWDAVTTQFNGAAFPECGQYRAWSWDEVERQRPDVLIVASSWRVLAALASKSTGSAAVAEVEAGLASSLERLVPSAGRTVLLASPPGTPDLQACATRFSSPDDCESEIDPVWYDVYEAEERVAEAVGATHIDTRGWFCHQGFCPAFVGNTAVYADGAHLTVEYAEQLGPVLREAMRQSARGNRSAAD